MATVGYAESIRYTADAVTPSNWQINSCCARGRGYAMEAGGLSDAVNAVGEFTEMHWGVRTGTMMFFVGETLVWNQDATVGDWPTIHLASALYEYAGGGETDQWFYFDWAELSGIPVEEGKAEASGDWQSWEGPESLRIVGPAALGAHRTDVVAQ